MQLNAERLNDKCRSHKTSVLAHTDVHDRTATATDNGDLRRAQILFTNWQILLIMLSFRRFESPSLQPPSGPSLWLCRLWNFRNLL